MTAEILAVGTELLLGDILNTNAQYLSKELAGLGVAVYHQTVVGDNPARLKKAYAEAFERADVVITSGGLGPTKDDLTKEIGAEYFGKKIELVPEEFEILKNHFVKFGRPMTKNNEKQACFPIGSTIIPNSNGTAPGCIINENGKILIMLPGPPRELVPMFEETVAPYLRERTDGMYVSRTLRICGVGESSAEEMIKDLIETQSNPTIAPYAQTNELTFRVTASAHTEEEAHKIMEPTIKELYNRFGDNIYGEGKETSLAQVIVNKLIEKNMTIAVAESCTGGMVASAIVDIAGSSKVFMEGVVTYSNEAKVKRLGVKEETLEKYGAVSAETAKEMAEGICKNLNTNIGVGITGIAGPDGGSTEKPVGLVYIGICINGETQVKEFQYSGGRQRIRSRALTSTFDNLRRLI